MKMFRTLGSAALVTVIAGGFVMAQDQGPHEAAIDARQSLMTLYAFNLGTLGGMAQGKMEYDADAAQVAADNLARLAKVNQSAMWPQGSDNESVEGTRALPAIWENSDDMQTKLSDLVSASEAMAEAAGTDLESLQGAMRGLGGACGACHEDYRESR